MYKLLSDFNEKIKQLGHFETLRNNENMIKALNSVAIQESEG